MADPLPAPLPDVMTAVDPYRYWAFVSYSHHDARVARALGERLGRTSVRGPARARVRGAPARFAPVYIDTREAVAAWRLDDELQQRMRESARLIVVCSPFAVASPEVAAEIRYFQSIGRESDILCVVASGIPDAAARGQPAVECLPDPLRPPPDASGRAQRPLAASLGGETEREWRHAVEQIAAGLVGVSLEEWRRLGRARGLRLALGAGAVAMALTGLAYGVAWAWWLPQYVYAKDAVRRWGRLEPVDVVDARVAAQRPVTLRFERRGAWRPFTEVRWLDGDGDCAAEGPHSIVGELFEFTCTRSQACGVRFDVGPTVGKEEVFDQFGTVVETVSYLDRHRAVLQEAVIGCSRRPGDIESVVFEREPDGPNAGVDRRRLFRGGEDKSPRPNSSYAFGLEETFDAAGRVTRRRLLGPGATPAIGSRGYAAVRHQRNEAGDVVQSVKLDLDERPVEGLDGVAATVFERDALGRPTAERYLDAQGRPTHDNRGVHGRRMQWDGRGRLLEVVNMGTDGRPQVDDRGVAIERSTYDAGGARRRTRYFDADDRPTYLAGSGCATVDDYMPRDANWSESRCFDADDRPTLGSQGWHLRRHTYSPTGQLLDQAFFDVVERPALTLDPGTLGPHHRWVSVFDERGNPIRSRMLGVDGRFSVAPGGTVGIDRIPNARNRVLREVNIGADERPTRHPEGHVALEYAYDSYGRIVDIRAVDAAGAPAPKPNGAYSTRIRYDERGHAVRREHRDVNGRYVVDDGADGDGWAVVDRRFDARGRVVESRYFDASERPQATPLGWFGDRVVRDAWGRIVQWTRLGADGQPEPDAAGVLMRRVQRDARGNETRLTLHGADGRLKAGSDGVALWHHELDGRGRVVLTLRAGVAGQLVANSNGSAGWRHGYDERGNETIRIHLGADGAPVVDRAAGCAVTVSRHDAYDRLQVQYCFDAAGRPMADDNGHHGNAYAYDAQGRIIEQLHVDASGQLRAGPDGVARVVTLYDASGGVAERRFAGADGRATRGGQAPIVRYRNDAWGREIERSFHDSEDRPIESPGSGRARARFERDVFGRLLVEVSLDREGRPMNRIDTGWSRREWVYGETGEVLAVRCTDAAGRPVARCNAVN